LGIAYNDEDCGKPVAYSPPIDGTWPSYASRFGHGQVSLGQPVSLPNAGSDGWAYTVTVLDPPSFVARTKTITVSTTILVTHITDNGFSSTISGSVIIQFVPGNIILQEADPIGAHAIKTTVECEQDAPAVSQSTTCTVSAVVSPDTIPNFFWWIGPNSSYVASAAAWPGQTA